MNLGGIGLDDVDRIGLGQDRENWIAVVNAVMNLRDPQNAGKLSNCYTTHGLVSSGRLHKVSLVMYEDYWSETFPNRRLFAVMSRTF
jgi:hypothetical protein